MSKVKFIGDKWIVRTTIDNSGDYPFPTYDILSIHKYGPVGVATAYQNPYHARLIAAAPDMYMAIRAALDTWDNGFDANGKLLGLPDAIYALRKSLPEGLEERE